MMHQFPQRDPNEDREAIERFERRAQEDNQSYFDVHQIEVIFEYYISKGDYTTALEAIEIGLKQHPMSTTLLLRKATMLMDGNQMDEAKSILLLLSKIETNEADVFLHLGSLYLYEGNLEDGLKCLMRAHFLASEMDEDLPDLVSDISNQLNFYSHYNETIKYLESLSQNLQKEKNIRFEYAVACENLMLFDKALEIYKSIIEDDPFLENAWYNYGNVFNKIGDFDNAIEAYLYTLALNPYHPDALFNIANCYAQSFNYQEALYYYTEYVASVDAFQAIVAYAYIGDCYERSMNYPMAFKFYQLLLQKNPMSIEGMIGSGNCYYEFKEFRLAIKWYKKSLELFPTNGAAWYSIGKCHFSLNQLNAATDSFKKAVELDENDTAAWFELYFLRHKLSKSDAESLFGNIENISAQNGALGYLAVIIYLEQDQPQKAFEMIQLAYDLNPDDMDILLDYYPEVYYDQQLADFIHNKLLR